MQNPDRRPLHLESCYSGNVGNPDPLDLGRQEHYWRYGPNTLIAGNRLKYERGYRRLGFHMIQGVARTPSDFGASNWHTLPIPFRRELAQMPAWLKNSLEVYSGFRITDPYTVNLGERAPDLTKSEDRKWFAANWGGWADAGIKPRHLWWDNASADTNKDAAVQLYNDYKEIPGGGEAIPIIGTGPGAFNLDPAYIDKMPWLITLNLFRDWSVLATIPWEVDPLTTEVHVMVDPDFLLTPDLTQAEVLDLVARGFIVGTLDSIAHARDATSDGWIISAQP